MLLGLLASAFARPMRYAAPRAVAVRLLPAGSLRAPAHVQAAEPAPPAAAPKPKIEKPVEEAPKPSKKALLLPGKEDKRKPTPPPVSRPGRTAAPDISLPSAGDDAAGTAGAGAPGAGGKTGIGSLKLDQADFEYPFYIRQMADRIGMNWNPTHAAPTSPVVHFVIQKDGTITDTRIITSSGLPWIDRAAQRAVMESSPLPPLPAEYVGPHLGIQVVFEFQ